MTYFGLEYFFQMQNETQLQNIIDEIKGRNVLQFKASSRIQHILPIHSHTHAFIHTYTHFPFLLFFFLQILLLFYT